MRSSRPLLAHCCAHGLLAVASLAIAVLAVPARAAEPEPPDFPFVQESDEDEYFVHFTNEDDHAYSITQAQQAADALARGGNPTPGNPKGYHDGYLGLGFEEPYFSGDRDVYYWDCKVVNDPDAQGCDNGQATSSRINMPTSVYSSQINVGSSSASEQCNRIVLGHELFHHVEFGYVFEASDGDTANCGPWPAAACEGHARMLQDHIYTDADLAINGGCLATQSTAANYLSDPGGTLWEYSYDTALFWKYLAQRYGAMQTEPSAGADFIQAWWENALDDYDAPDIIQLTRTTIQDAGGVGVDAAFHDFTIANVAKDYDLTPLSASEEAKYAYKDERQGFGQGGYGSVQIFFDPTISPGEPFDSFLGPDQYGVVYAQTRVGECPIGSVIRYRADVESVDLALMSLLLIRGDEVVDVRKKVGSSWEVARTQPLPRYGRWIAPVAGLSDDIDVDIQFRCSNPTTGFPLTDHPRPTHGGQVDDFAILPVDVDVYDPDGPIPGLAAEDFRVEIGDPPTRVEAPVRGVVESDGRYRVLVEVPSSVAAGRYPLHLHMGGNSISGEDAVFRGPRLPDQILLVDRSSSTGQSSGTQSRLDTQRRVASFWVSLLGAGIGGGIGSMANDGDDDAAIEIPLDLVTDAHRAALRVALTGIGPPQGTTPLGDALALCAREFAANGAADQERHVVLLSDGGQGGGAAYDAVRSELLDSGARVHAIAIGADADQGLLQEIAYETGGSYEYVPLPIPSQGFANALSDALARAAERAAGRVRVAAFEGAITLSTPFAISSFTIEETGLSDAVIAVHWESPASDLNVTFQRPDGTAVQDGVLGARIFDTGTHVVAQVPNLSPGTWQILTGGTGSPTFTGSASARARDGAYVLTSVQHAADPEPVSGRAGAFAAQLPVAIATALHDAGGPILGATVKVEVTAPATDDEVLVAFDHGEIGDGREDDGVYTALFHATNAYSATGLPDAIGGGDAGSYRVRVVAAGTDAAGHAFERIAESSFWVGLGDAIDSDGDAMLDRYEALHACLGSGANDAASDPDGDGIGSGAERVAGTEPCRSDSDRGGERDDSEIARGANPFDPADDALPAPGYFSLISHVLEHTDDDPRFVPRPLANLLRVPAAPEFALIVIQRRGSPTAPWIERLRVDPRTLGGAFADEGLSAGATFAYRMYGIDAVGRRSAMSRVVEATVKQDPVAPIGALRIDTPAPRTDDTTVPVDVELYRDAPAGMQMKLWWADEPPPRDWSPFAPQRLVPLEPASTPTTRTLLALLRDAAGNESIRYGDSVEVFPPNSLGAVSGSIAPTGGGPLGGVLVQLVNAPGEAPILTGADGSFTLVDLAPGTWALAFFDGADVTTVPGITVTPGATTQLGVIPIPEPGSLALGAIALASIAALRRGRRDQRAPSSTSRSRASLRNAASSTARGGAGSRVATASSNASASARRAGARSSRTRASISRLLG